MDGTGAAGWSEMLRGANLPRAVMLVAGAFMFAVNTFIVVTILPSVVRDIGGLRFFAWNTTLYVVASLVGGALLPRLLRRIGARRSYRVALAIFAVGSVGCALAPAMAVLLVGRVGQGLGAGMLSALSYSMVRVLFPERLWSRGIGLISAMWGIATLGGPAIGGAFAQAGAWRAAFWTVAAMAPCLLLLVEATLPRDLPRSAAQRSPLALLNLAVLAASVLAVSAGSMSPAAWADALGLAGCAVGLAWFVRLEAAPGPSLLPHQAWHPATRLGATYGAQSMLLVGITAEIFVPYFLQTLHGLSPLSAGYLSALMSAGWTIASVGSSGASGRRARLAQAAGPVSMAVSLALLCLLMPRPGLLPGTEQVAAIGVCLFGMGLGIGLCWPHLGARVFTSAPEAERELAASSITVVLMVSNAFGSALGGMVTTLAGLTNPGGAVGAASAASWLFGLFAVAPVLAGLAVRRSQSA